MRYDAIAPFLFFFDLLVFLLKSIYQALMQFLTRRLAKTPFQKFALSFSRRLSSDIAFVFDIDGVLVRGSHPLPKAKEALELLNKHKVPFILMTNGGGYSEKIRTDFLSSKIGFLISPLQLVQSHTPMKALAHENGYNRVMVVGGPQDKARHCALGYGFQDVIMPVDIVRAFPGVSPHHRFNEEELINYALEPSKSHLDKPIDAVLVFNDPRDMGTDIQIVSDMLNSQNGKIGTKRNTKELKNREDPAIPIIFSNNDFVFASDYPLPRFGQGAFRIIIEQLYREINGLDSHENLHSIIMGKPFKIQYDFAHFVLIDWRKKLMENRIHDTNQTLPELNKAPADSPFSKIYMVGDNPASDIKGANDHGWESLLVRTGVFKDDDWDSIVAKPTGGVFDNVLESVKYALAQNRII
ncbi:uncharacterized protein PRCAT00002139001 [Priceomyces carsonii]|uniref:uncharacterized protein n=1 Tax=Priceomyces carsonii TaxID=28549 RepID=UPI002EDA45EC|nr:unnamed protein product [Priceomyces carsonii]